MPKPLRTRRRAKPRARGDGGVLDRLRDHLERLGLKELDQHRDTHLAWAHEHNPPPLVLLERVLGDGAQRLRQRRVERRIDTCGLRVRKALEAFDWAFQPSLNRAFIESLATLAFIDNHEDLLITGKSGTGKSHILQALTLRACE